MEPANNRNLNMFLVGYYRCGLAAVIGASEPKLLSELSVRKRWLSVMMAADVTEPDIEP